MKKNIVFLLSSILQFQLILGATSPQKKPLVTQPITAKKQRKKLINFIIINNIHYKAAAIFTSLLIAGIPLWIFYQTPPNLNNSEDTAPITAHTPPAFTQPSNNINENTNQITHISLASTQSNNNIHPEHRASKKKSSRNHDTKQPLETMSDVIRLLKQKNNRKNKRLVLAQRLGMARMAEVYQAEALRTQQPTPEDANIL